MRISTRLAQRSGFVVIILLFAMSMLMAWRVQEIFSERSFEIYRKFVHEQELLGDLRRSLWAGSVALRDFYLDPDPEREPLLRELDSVTKDSARDISELRRISAHQAEAEELQRRFAELWDSTRTAAEGDWDDVRRFHFLQKEIAPRREQASQVLRDIEKANQTSLTDSQIEMRDTRSNASRTLLLMLGAGLLCGVAVAWLSILHSERLEAQAADRFREVLAAKLQLEELSARLMEVQEEERTRLSRELHDEIVQNLAVLKMEIVQAQAVTPSIPPEALEPLERARRLAEETVRSVRDISLLLRPSLLDDLGLGPALQWQTEEFSSRTGVPCRLEEHNLTEDLPESLKTCVYRVAQEALRNCEKHSSATLVHVKVEQTSEQLKMTVDDNGVGFRSKERKPSSLGLLGMRERAYSLGGQLETTNRLEGGARVCLNLPLSPSAGNQLLS